MVQTIGFLTITALTGRNFKSKALLGSITPFLVFTIDYVKRKTSAAKAGKEPVWDETVEDIEIVPGRNRLIVQVCLVGVCCGCECSVLHLCHYTFAILYPLYILILHTIHYTLFYIL